MLTREQVLVKKIKEWTESSYIGDDCAVLADGKLVSSDTLVEGTHFRLDFASWRQLGWKSCAVNLSDIAAMAGRPRYLTVALTLPAQIENLEEHLEQFYLGFTQCAKSFGAEVVGGDLTVGPHLVVNVTVIGESHEAGLLLRSGAQPGDVVIVSGNFGSSAAGLQLLLQGAGVTKSKQGDLPAGSGELLLAHLEPSPRLCEAWALARLVGSRGALMDASDGLGDALWQIAEQSQVDIEVDIEAIPLSAAMTSFASSVAVDPYLWALYGGEDYELVATISADDWLKAQSQPGESFPFKKIGVVLNSQSPASKPEIGSGRVRLLATDHGVKSCAGVVNLSNCFKHF